jgi:O-antigen/teichoic acid export membrane protein
LNESPDTTEMVIPTDRDLSLRNVAARVGRQSVAYTLSSAVGPLTGVFLLPVYTRYLTPGDYGLIALLEVLSLVLTTVFSLGLTAMIPFYYVDLPAGRERRRGVGTVMMAVTALNLMLAALVILFGAAPIALALPSVPFWPYVPILALTALFEPYWIAVGAIYQIQERAFTFSAWSTARIVLAVGLKVLYVVVLAQGVYGFIVSSLLTAVITAVVTAPLLWREMEPSLDRDQLRRAFAVGGPTVPNNLFTYGFRVLDRVILDRFVDQGQIGLYYMALKLGDMVKLGADVFVNAWRPVFFKEAADLRFRSETVPSVIRLASVGIMGGCLAIALFAREIVAVLTTPAYAGAARFVPLVVGAMAVKGIYAFPYLAVWYKKRTAWVPLLTVATMAFSVTANVLLMPRWGALGAAVVLFASYLLLFGLMMVLAQRSFPLRYPWKALISAAAASSVAAAIGTAIPVGPSAIVLKLMLIGAYAAIAVLSGAVRIQELTRLLHPSKLLTSRAAVGLR